MKYFYQIMLILASALLLVYLGAVIGSSVTQKGSQIDTKTKVDTLLIHDTTMVTESIFVKQRVVDTMMVAVTDTIIRNDTTFVYLPKQQREYRSPQFRAWVSGYDPKLDSIKIYQTTKQITKEIPVIQKQRSRWGVGIQAGYGATREGLSPYVGVGVSYNLISW